MGEMKVSPLFNARNMFKHVHQWLSRTVRVNTGSLFQLNRIERKVNRIMATQDDLVLEVTALTQQVSKILTEVTTASDILRARIVALEEQLANASSDAIPALEAAVSDLKLALQGLDEVNPDA